MEARDLGVDERRHVVGRGVYLIGFVFLGVDGDLDGDLPSSDFLALKELEGLLLLLLGTYIDETIAFGATRLTPSTTNDASRGDGNPGGSKEFGKGGVIYSEAEVGDEEHGLGRFTLGGFTDWTNGFGGFDSRSLDLLWLGLSRSSGGGSASGISFTLFGICLGLFGLARVALLLGFSVSRCLAVYNGILGLGSISSAVGNICFVARSLGLFCGAFLGSALFFLFLLFLFRGLCDFNDEGTTVEFLLVEELYSLLSGLGGIEGDKTITSRTSTTENDLSRDDVLCNGAEKGFEALVGSSVGQVTSKNLVARLLIDCWGWDSARVDDGSSVNGDRISHLG